MEGTSLVSVSQYDGGRRRVMDDGTYDIDIEVGPGRCGMSTLVLFLPHTTRPPQQSHTPRLRLRRSVRWRVPTPATLPSPRNPGSAGNRPTTPTHALLPLSCSMEATDGSTLLVVCPILHSGDMRRRAMVGDMGRTRKVNWTTGLGKPFLLSVHGHNLKLFF